MDPSDGFLFSGGVKNPTPEVVPVEAADIFGRQLFTGLFWSYDWRC